MKIGAAFPSKFLKAVDFQGKAWQMQITAVRVEEVGTEQKPEHKPVLYFAYQGKHIDKGLVLNRTNADTIAMDLGDETDAWIGHTLELFSMRVQGPNGMTDGIRLRVIHAGQPATAPGGHQAPLVPRAAPAAPIPFGNDPPPATPSSYGAPLRDDEFPPFGN